MSNKIVSGSISEAEQRENKIFALAREHFSVLLAHHCDWSACHLSYNEIKMRLEMGKEEFDTTIQALGFIITAQDKFNVVFDIPEYAMCGSETQAQTMLRVHRRTLCAVLNPESMVK